MLSMRAAVAADIDAVRDMTERAYAIYLPLLGYPPVPVTEDYGPRIEGGEVWLQELDGAPTGLAVVEEHEDHLMIFSLVVEPEAQGKGCGQALLKWVEARAEERGLREIRLYTNARMERNIGIYAANGYVETGRRPNPKRPQFTIVDMIKTLEEKGRAQ